MKFPGTKNQAKALLLVTILTGLAFSASAQQWTQNSSAGDTYGGYANDKVFGLGGGTDVNVYHPENLSTITTVSGSYDGWGEYSSLFESYNSTHLITARYQELLLFNTETYSKTTVQSGLTYRTATLDKANDRVLQHGDGSDIVAVDIPSGSTTTLVSDADGPYIPLDMYNGNLIYANSNENVVEYDLDTDSVVDNIGGVYGGQGQVCESKDILAYFSSNQNIVVYDLDSDSVINTVSKSWFDARDFTFDSSCQFLFVSQDSSGGNSVVLDSAEGWDEVYDTGSHGTGYATFLPNSELMFASQGLTSYNSAGKLVPPSVTLNEPNDGDNFKIPYGLNGAGVDVDFEIETNQIDTNYSVKVNGTEEASGTVQADSTPVSVTETLNLSAGTYDISVEANNDGGSDTTTTNTITVEETTEPTVTIDNPTDGQTLWIPSGQTSMSIPTDGWVNGSEETGDAQAEVVRIRSGTSNAVCYSGTQSIQIGDNDISLSTGCGISDFGTRGNYEATLEAIYDNATFTSQTVQFSLEQVDPLIATDLSNKASYDTNLEPDIEDIQPGEAFNISISGPITNASIDEVEYELQVSNEPNPSPITKQPNFQDQNSWTDSVTNVFEMQESWQGETITITATITDANGNTDSTTASADTRSPPDNFIQNAPDDGQVFLIPEGDSNTSVDIEYGVDTAEYGGTAKLILNGNQVDSFSIGSASQDTRTYTDTYTEDTYNWKIEFTDSQGVTYESSERTFQVTDEPISLNLQSPSGGETIDIVNTSSTTIDHDFEVDARATSNSYYYRFTLNNSDTNNQITQRTSGSFDTGIASYTESVSNLGEGNYSWGIKVYRSSDDTLLEAKQTTYSIEENPKFNQDVLRPLDGETIVLDPDQSSKQVDTVFDIETFNSQVETDVVLNGGNVDTVTTSSNFYRRHTVDLGQLTSGDYTLKINSEDGENRQIKDTINFEVATSEEAEISFTELRTDPPLDEATVGEQFDIYFEGTGNVSDVDYVQIDLTAEDGEVIDTYLVETEDLESGSWYGTIVNAGTVTADLIGKEVGLYAEAQTFGGQLVTAATNYFVGSSTEVSADLQQPADGKTLAYSSPQKTKFQFEVYPDGENVSYIVEAKETGTQNWQTLWATIPGNEIDGSKDSQVESMYINMSDAFGSYYGNFSWRVNLTEETSGNTEIFGNNEFEIVQDTGQPILNFNQPEDNSVFTVNNPGAKKQTDFNWRLDNSGKDGIVTLEINGDSVETWDVTESTEQGSYTENLPTGDYVTTLKFDSDSANLEEEHTFTIRTQNDTRTCGEGEQALNSVFLDKPADGSTFYQDVQGGTVGKDFSWEVCGDAEGLTAARIFDDQNNLVYTMNDYYHNVEESRSFGKTFDTSALSPGQYTWKGVYNNSDSGTLYNSSTRQFEIVDFTPPETFDMQPDGETFVQGEDVTLEWSTETFEDDITVTTLVRPAGTYTGTSEFTAGQQASTIRDYSTNVSRTKGQYEWWVRMEAAGLTFESNKSTFTVIDDDVKDAEIELHEPLQDTRFQLNNKTEVPVKFNWTSTVYSETDAKVRLQLQNVSERNSQFENIYTANQNNADGETTDSYMQNLTEGGYRWRVRVEYPNGQLFNSTSRSFAVGEADIPSPEPAAGVIQDTFGFFGDLNKQVKEAAGSTGQFFIATLVTLILSGILHLWWKMEYLTMAATLLIVLGFSLADGYFPIATFYILGAISAAAAAYLGIQILGGD